MNDIPSTPRAGSETVQGRPHAGHVPPAPTDHLPASLASITEAGRRQTQGHNDPPSFLRRIPKFLHQLDRLRDFQRGHVWPTHVVVFPTTRCQLHCPFCNYANRGSHEDLPWDVFKQALKTLAEGGIKAMEFSGGGEPTCWPHLSSAILSATDAGVQVGLMTNGVDLPQLSRRALGACEWVRIDVKGQGYLAQLQVPCDDTFVSTSYVWHRQSKRSDLDAIAGWCRTHDMDCRVTFDVLGLSHKEIRVGVALAREIGPPLHPVEPVVSGAPACYMAWFKPVLAWDGFLYACPCTGLSRDNARALQERFRFCHASRIKETYDGPVHALGHRCSFCKYAQHNHLLADARAEVKHENFI